MSRRLGILGGMFDPVHNGHIAAARHASQLLGLEQVVLVPCHVPNHREPNQLDSSHRLQMLKLAVSDDSTLRVDDREIRRGGVSYAVDTVREF